MKIVVSPGSSAQSRSPARPRDSSPGFARLIEQGLSSKQVLSRRALSFGEAGLLGIRIAVEESEAKGPRHSDLPVARIGSNPAISFEQSKPMPALAEQQQIKRHAAASLPQHCPGAPAGTDPGEVSQCSAMIEAAAVAFAAEASTEPAQTSSAPLRRPSGGMVQSGRAGAPALRLIETDQGTLVMVSAPVDDKLDEGILTRLARATARNFGARIRQVILRRFR